METLFLLVWMTVADQNVLTVQAVPAELCHAMRRASGTNADVTQARCFREAHDIDAAIASSECSPIEVREDFVNFICRK